MYGSEKYRVIPSYADPTLLPVFAYTIILYVVLAIFMFLNGCDKFTAGGDYYPDWKVYHTRNSGIPDSREFATTIDEWNVKYIGTGFGGVAKLNEKK